MTTKSVHLGEPSDYHSRIHQISRSMLVTFMQSRRRFQAMYVDKTIEQLDETLAMKIGSFTHQQILEPHLDSLVEIIPAEVLSATGTKAGKAWKEYEAANIGKVLLKESEYDTAMGCIDALRRAMWGHINHPKAQREVDIAWTHANGLELRAKLDLLVVDDGVAWLSDMKTCADLERFPNQVRESMLYIQAVHYREAAKQHCGILPIFWFCATEKDPPYRVRHFELSDDAMAEAEVRYNKALDDVAACFESGDWHEEGEDSSIVITKRQAFGWEER